MSQKLGFTANIKGENKHIRTKLSLIEFNKEGIVYIYAPSLDLYGYGKNKREAMDFFKISLLEFIEYASHKKTLFRELERLGWTVKKTKERTTVKMPQFTQLLEKNKDLNRIMNNLDYKKFTEDVPFAIPAY